MLSTLGSSTEILPGELALSETRVCIPGFNPSGPWRSGDEEEEIIKVCAACCEEVMPQDRICPHCRSNLPRL